MAVTIVTGGFWGDEGKGKVVAYLARRDRPPVVARAGVGPNAGHTVFLDGEKHVVRQIPVAVLEPSARLLIGPGVLVDPEVTLDEVERFGVSARRLGIDARCTVIEPEHRQADRERSFLRDVVGTTGSGCGPAQEARTARAARLAADEPRLAPYLADVPLELGRAIGAGRDVLVEGTQGFGLSLYHGDYPFVTSKDTTASTFCADVGIGPTQVSEVLVVFKAYASRVGEGPLPTQLPDGEVAARGWEEFGAVTGRARRIGEFDFDHARRAVMINGATALALTNLDRRYHAAAGATSWHDLPDEARAFVRQVEDELERPVALVSTGAEVASMIDRRAGAATGG
jgi:adenylosuccinate synthase